MAVTILGPRGLVGATQALRALIRGTLELEGLRPGEISVLLADDEKLRDLNRRWRDIDRATDVLSFALDHADARGTLRRGARLPVGGDLAISLDRTLAQARRFRVREGDELARLAIHGTLHLAGHDHARPGERSRMRAREDRALAAGAGAAHALDRALAAWRRRV